MSFIETLMNMAAADTDVLRSLDESGDDFSVPRDVDFLIKTPDKRKAELVRDFVNDHSYGQAKIERTNAEFRVSILINLPVTQHIILSVSGFVATIAKLYDVEYDGWGCVAQKQS